MMMIIIMTLTEC